MTKIFEPEHRSATVVHCRVEAFSHCSRQIGGVCRQTSPHAAAAAADDDDDDDCERITFKTKVSGQPCIWINGCCPFAMSSTSFEHCLSLSLSLSLHTHTHTHTHVISFSAASLQDLLLPCGSSLDPLSSSASASSSSLHCHISCLRQQQQKTQLPLVATCNGHTPVDVKH